jgi:hypothetical protein
MDGDGRQAFRGADGTAPTAVPLARLARPDVREMAVGEAAEQAARLTPAHLGDAAAVFNFDPAEPGRVRVVVYDTSPQPGCVLAATVPAADLKRGLIDLIRDALDAAARPAAPDHGGDG